MGAVYPWKDVAERRVPTVEAFGALRARALRCAYESDAIVAAAVYGSVARGDHGRRSDFDMLLVHRTCDAQEAARVLCAIRAYAAESNIALSAHLLSVRQGRSGEHPFGASYREDWRRLKRSGHVVGAPARHVYAPVVSAAEEMVKALPLRFGRVRQLGFELRRAFNGCRLDAVEEVLGRAQQQNNRPLHFYIACARWLMRWKDGTLACESKADVFRSFMADSRFSRLHAPFGLLAGIDRDYDGLLDRGLHGALCRTDYLLSVRRMLRRAVDLNDQMARSAKSLLTRNEHGQDVRASAA
jgi:hypothetical protein